MSTPIPGSAEATAEYEQLLAVAQRQLSDLRSADRGPSGAELLEGLDTAWEELRVADEEVRVQQVQITHLREGHDALRAQVDRTLGVLPVPVIVTDRDGLIRSINGAAVEMTGSPADQLIGRPLFGLFDTSDRRELRRVLLDPDRADRQSSVTLSLRVGVEVEVVLSAGGPGTSEVTWLLLVTTSDYPPAVIARLPGALVELAALPAHTADVATVMRAAAEICQTTIAAGAVVSINLGPPDRPEQIWSTSQTAQQLDGAQITSGHGPCVDAYHQQTIVHSDDVGHDPRWPGLGAHLGDLVLGSVSAPIMVGSELEGALNLYGEPDTLGPAALPTVEVLAAGLGGVLYELDLAAQLDRLRDDMDQALSSRAVIEQAKGVVMARRGGSPEAAFAHLQQLASTGERKLRDVARSLVEQASDSR